VKVAGIVVAVTVALVLQTTMARFFVRGSFAVDLILVVVIYIALTAGPVAGMLSGAAAGLAQDALSSGLIGIGGLAKTVVGFLVGTIASTLIVTQPLPRFVAFAGGTLLHGIISVGLYTLLDVRQFGSPYGAIAGQAIVNAVVGVLSFHLSELLPGAVERRRAQRTRIRR
jgi:rod shape-determining protein MreD